MAILVIAEHDNGVLNSATLSTLTAAGQIADEIHVLVAGYPASAVANTVSRLAGVHTVLIAEQPVWQHWLAENIAALIVTLAAGYSHILAPATTEGKNYLPRVAALLDVEQISEISTVISEDTFERPVYAGNAIATVRSSAPVKVITVRPSAFSPAGEQEKNAPIVPVESPQDSELSAFVSEETNKSDRPDLFSARVVISGGWGMQSGDNFHYLYTLAENLGGAVGASRAAVDAGFAPNDLQVGQTGKVVAPELYIAVGISGAIQHLAGMKESRTIVAINKDEDAPIFQVADYGLVADWQQVLPELIQLTQKK
ncbi:MAG: electron transfer flavoprotein subunit alpha/FixB family protein [Enterobacteriaceae bacterium]